MAIEIVDFPIKNGDFNSYVNLPEGMARKIALIPSGYVKIAIENCDL